MLPHPGLSVVAGKVNRPVKDALRQGKDEVFAVRPPELIGRVKAELYEKIQGRSEAKGVPEWNEVFFPEGVEDAGVNQQVVEHAKGEKQQEQGKLDVGFFVPPFPDQINPAHGPAGPYGDDQQQRDDEVGHLAEKVLEPASR